MSRTPNPLHHPRHGGTDRRCRGLVRESEVDAFLARRSTPPSTTACVCWSRRHASGSFGDGGGLGGMQQPDALSTADFQALLGEYETSRAPVRALARAPSDRDRADGATPTGDHHVGDRRPSPSDAHPRDPRRGQRFLSMSRSRSTCRSTATPRRRGPLAQHHDMSRAGSRPAKGSRDRTCGAGSRPSRRGAGGRVSGTPSARRVELAHAAPPRPIWRRDHPTCASWRLRPSRRRRGLAWPVPVGADVLAAAQRGDVHAWSRLRAPLQGVYRQLATSREMPRSPRSSRKRPSRRRWRVTRVRSARRVGVVHGSRSTSCASSGGSTQRRRAHERLEAVMRTGPSAAADPYSITCDASAVVPSPRCSRTCRRAGARRSCCASSKACRPRRLRACSHHDREPRGTSQPRAHAHPRRARSSRLAAGRCVVSRREHPDELDEQLIDGALDEEARRADDDAGDHVPPSFAAIVARAHRIDPRAIVPTRSNVRRA